MKIILISLLILITVIFAIIFWIKKKNLAAFKKLKVKIAILIISSNTVPAECITSETANQNSFCRNERKNNYGKIRYNIAKKTWEKYMNLHPNIDCYFLEFRKDLKKNIILKNNYIYIKGIESLTPGILNKTMLAMNLLKNKYDYFIRTNCGTFYNLFKLYKWIKQKPRKKFYFGNSLWVHHKCNLAYAQGFDITMSKDIVKQICKMYVKYKNIKYKAWPKFNTLCGTKADDCMIGYMVLYTTNIKPSGHSHVKANKNFLQPAKIFNKYNFKKLIRENSLVYGYRVKRNDLQLIKDIYKFLLDFNYNITH